MTMRAASRTAATPLTQAFSGLAGPASRRTFATSRRADASYGFIGLGQMGEYHCGPRATTTWLTVSPAGYPMARNLRSKIAQSDTMCIHDVNPAVCEQFEKEVGNVKVVQSVREIAENSVCAPHPYTPPAST